MARWASSFCAAVCTWVYQAVWRVLFWCGIKRTVRVLCIGLDNAGKTHLLYTLQDQQPHHMPTMAPTLHRDITVGNARLRVWDLSGKFGARRVWRDYFPCMDGVVFVVDAADSSRWDEAKDDLQSVLSSELLEDTPCLILCSKIDHKSFKGETQIEMKKRLGVDEITDKNPKRAGLTRLYMCSAVKRIGYQEGLLWLADECVGRKLR